MNRRQMLAGTAALPAAALPLAGIAATVNGTDAIWHELIAAEADHKAADAAMDAAEAAWLPDGLPDETIELPALDGFPAKRLTLTRLRGRRDFDQMLRPLHEDALKAARRMIDDEMAMRSRRTPEAIAERRALYDRLEADLVAREAAAQTVRPAHIIQLEGELIAAEKRAAAAEEALFAAPVLTIEDAARKLQIALDFHMDAEDYSAELVASALDGLRRLAGTA